MNQKVDYYSCGLNQYNQLTHGIEDGLFHKMVIPENLKIKKMKCGRSHILALTFDDLLYCNGANYDGQCGVGHSENLTEWEQCLLINTNNNNEKNFVTNITDFSCGWVHSVCILENGKSLYYTGAYVSALQRGDIFQSVNNVIPLKEDQIYTKVISGDHTFSVVIDNYLIYHINGEPILIDALQETGTIINEYVATGEGFLLTNQKGELFAFNNLLNNQKVLTKVNLNGFVKCLTAAHTYEDIAYQLNDKKHYTFYNSTTSHKDGENVADYYEIQPLYYGCLLYNKKDRKLFAIGCNEDFTLGINSKDEFNELTEVKTINEYLEKNQEVDIDEIIEGCDVTVLVMKEKETKNLKLFLEKLRKCLNSDELSDILIIR